MSQIIRPRIKNRNKRKQAPLHPRKIEHSVEEYLKRNVPRFDGNFQIFAVEVPNNLNIRDFAYKR